MTVWGPLDNLLQENAQLQADLAASREREQRLVAALERVVAQIDMVDRDELIALDAVSFIEDIARAALAAAAPAAEAREPRGKGV